MRKSRRSNPCSVVVGSRLGREFEILLLRRRMLPLDWPGKARFFPDRTSDLVMAGSSVPITASSGRPGRVQRSRPCERGAHMPWLLLWSTASQPFCNWIRGGSRCAQSRSRRRPSFRSDDRRFWLNSFLVDGHRSSFPRQILPEFWLPASPLERAFARRGRRECRVFCTPAALCAKDESTQA